MTGSVIAFDFGTKNIGVASGHSAVKVCSELTPLKAKEGIPDWDQIAALFAEYQPNTVLVGLPLNMDGSEQELTRRARKFGNRIQGRFGLDVTFVDERLTTRASKEEAHARGRPNHFANNPVDSIAARLLIECWWNESTSENS